MSKIVLNAVADLTSTTTAQTTINNNSNTIQTAFDNTLSRDGTTPNQMGSNLDMNSNQILNLPSPGSASSPARLQDVTGSVIISSVPPVGTSGAVVPFLNGINTWSGAQTFSNPVTINNTLGVTGAVSLTGSSVQIQNGKPWADVTAWGAVGDNSTDCASAIQSAVNFLNSNFGGGIVFFPPGTYRVLSTVTVKSAVRLVGASRLCTTIGNSSAGFAGPLIAFDSSCTYAGAENLFIFGYIGGSPTQPTVTVANGVPVTLKDCHIWGGTNALQIGGVDGLIENCYINGYTNNVSSTGANWYIRCKLDSGGSINTTTNGYLQNAYFTTGTGENHFVQCDFSGTMTNAVTINDSAGNNAITTFEGCVFGAPIVLTNHKFSMFSACELGSTTFTVGTSPCCITGCVALAAAITVSGAGKVLAGNYNIT